MVRQSIVSLLLGIGIALGPGASPAAAQTTPTTTTPPAPGPIVVEDLANGALTMRTEVPTFELPVRVRAPLAGALEYTADLGPLSDGAGHRVEAALTRRRQPIDAWVRLPAGREQVLLITGSLAESGTYRGTLRVLSRPAGTPDADVSKVAEQVVQLAVERAVAPTSVTVDDVGAVAEAGIARADVAIPIDVRETAGHPRTLHLDEHLPLTYQAATTTRRGVRATFGSCADARRGRGDQSVEVPAATPRSLVVHLCGLEAPGRYTGNLRLTQVGSATPIATALDISLRWPLWLALLLIGAGVFAGWVVQRYHADNDTVLALQLDVARIRDDLRARLDRLTMPRDPQVAAVVTRLEQALRDAYRATQQTLDADKKVVEDVRRTVPLTERWLRALAAVEAMPAKPSGVTAALDRIGDWLEQSHAADTALESSIVDAMTSAEETIRQFEAYAARYARLANAVVVWRAAGDDVGDARTQISELLADAEAAAAKGSTGWADAATKLDAAERVIADQLAASLTRLADEQPVGVEPAQWDVERGKLRLAALSLGSAASADPTATYDAALREAMGPVVAGLITHLLDGHRRPSPDRRQAYELALAAKQRFAEGRVGEALLSYREALTAIPREERASGAAPGTPMPVATPLPAVRALSAPGAATTVPDAVPPADAVLARYRRRQWLVTAVAIVVSTISGVLLLWNGDTSWGGFADGAAAVLWGLGITVGSQAGFAGVAGVVDKLAAKP